MFANLNYEEWCLNNKLPELFGVKMEGYNPVNKKREKSLYGSVDPRNKIPFAPEWDDLTRLHFLVRSRKVTTLLEFGVGKSTLVFADAMRKNKEEFGDMVVTQLRRVHPFEIHSVDTHVDWIKVCKENFQSDLLSYVQFHLSDVEMATFNGRACTLYKQLPNICPDFIYLDGPDQFSVKGDIRGISTASSDRMPMAADILMFEPFLLPGTLIVVDGRTANARFLKNNLQQNWSYHHFLEEDLHTFELVEPPLGKFNANQLAFCLGTTAMR